MNRDLMFGADRGLGFMMPLVPRLSSIKDGVEGGSIATCRICHKSNGKKDDDLISPCKCKGAQQFVHRSCLDHWRSVNEDSAFSHCTTCKAQFHLRVIEFQQNCNLKFRLIVARDIFLISLAVQIVTGMMGGVAYLADKHGAFRNLFNDSWIHSLSRQPIPFYYCLGFLVFLVLLVFFGFILYYRGFNDNPTHYVREECNFCFCECGPLVVFYMIIAAFVAFNRIWRRYYHILKKRQLTKEYLVEDLHLLHPC